MRVTSSLDQHVLRSSENWHKTSQLLQLYEMFELFLLRVCPAVGDGLPAHKPKDTCSPEKSGDRSLH